MKAPLRPDYNQYGKHVRNIKRWNIQTMCTFVCVYLFKIILAVSHGHALGLLQTIYNIYI